VFKRRTGEEKAARAQRKAERKAGAEQRKAELRDKWKADKERRQADAVNEMKTLLQDGETLDGVFRTNDLLLKKHVLVTSKRLIVGMDARNADSFFYPHVAGIQTANLLGDKDLVVTMAGGKNQVELHFASADDRDHLHDLISARLTTG
jgi:hypothetical protein